PPHPYPLPPRRRRPTFVGMGAREFSESVVKCYVTHDNREIEKPSANNSVPSPLAGEGQGEGATAVTSARCILRVPTAFAGGDQCADVAPAIGDIGVALVAAFGDDLAAQPVVEGTELVIGEGPEDQRAGALVLEAPREFRRQPATEALALHFGA